MAVARRNRSLVGYGLDNALQGLSPLPIVSQRNPTVNDSAEIGTVWINSSNNDYFILTSVYAGSANWASQGSSIGIFTQLSVDSSDQIDLVTTAGVTISAAAADGISFTNGTQSVKILVGTGSPSGSVSAPHGSLFFNVAGSATNNRMYINTNGTTGWTAVITAS